MNKCFLFLLLIINVHGFSQTLRRYSFEKTPIDNTLISEGKYNDKKEMIGEWKFYYSSGKELHSIGNYQEGKRVGLWKTYYRSGNLQQDNDIDKGKVIGYYENGVIKYEWYNEGEKRLKSIYYKENGSLDFKLLNDSINDLKIPYGFIYTKGLLTYEGFYSPFTGSGHDKMIDGIYYKYYKNGNIKDVITYSEHWLRVKTIRYFKNGQIKSNTGMYRNKYDGKFIYYSKKGQLILKSSFKDGKPFGKYVEYYKNGNIKEEKEYNDKGKIIGNVTFYNKNGKIIYKDKAKNK
jgi:antitoxin component YwqK of YwqJK toxin-antitoxin module